MENMFDKNSIKFGEREEREHFNALTLSVTLLSIFLFSQKNCILLFTELEKGFVYLSEGRKRAKSGFQVGYLFIKWSWLSHLDFFGSQFL